MEWSGVGGEKSGKRKRKKLHQEIKMKEEMEEIGMETEEREKGEETIREMDGRMEGWRDELTNGHGSM